jgi:Helix-turn-helix of DDE superfamily endonuclease
MAGVRFTDLQSRPMEFLDFTSLTLNEFQQLVPPFETAFHTHMAVWRMDGKPRTARRFTVYKNCPLPTPEDRLLFILVSLKTYALQVVHGRLFGMVQGKANQWIHVLLPVLLAALRALGDAPARSLSALAQRLGVSEADAATVVTPLAEEPAPVVAVPTAAPAAPLLLMTAPSGGLSGCVANFAQEVVKEQLPLSVGGLGGQRVEHFSRSAAFVSSLNHHLFFLNHVHEFDTDERPLGCLERFEP